MSDESIATERTAGGSTADRRSPGSTPYDGAPGEALPAILPDGGRNPASDEEDDGSINRAEVFHEKSGGFEEVGKALLILLLLGLVVYFVFVVL